MSKVEEVFSEMEMLDIDIAELMIILKNKAVDGYVDYKEFIDETFWLILKTLVNSYACDCLLIGPH